MTRNVYESTFHTTDWILTLKINYDFIISLNIKYFSCEMLEEDTRAFGIDNWQQKIKNRRGMETCLQQ